METIYDYYIIFLEDQLNTSMEQVSAAASSVTALQTMVTVNQMNSPLNSQFTAAGGIIVPQRTIIPARPPKLTRPRQESSGASPGSSSGVGSVHSDPFCSSSDSDSAAPSSKAPKVYGQIIFSNPNGHPNFLT